MLERLRHLRDVLNLTWREIGFALRMGSDDGHTCAAAYHRWLHPNGREYRRQQKKALAPKVERLRPAGGVNPPPDDSPIYGGGRVPFRTPSDQTISRPGAPPPSPSARRYNSALTDDIRSRIQAQGITAGLFGDPPPGRSALDRRGETT